MYKLLLVSDRKDVLNAFGEVENWERLGFKAPHIRHDFAGAKESLGKHHADGIAIAIGEEEKEELIAYLRQEFPYIPVFQAGTTRDEVVFYLGELKTILNRLRADFSSDFFSEKEVMLECRHDLLRKLVSGELKDEDRMYRHMRLLRSRMDANRPCVLIEMKQPEGAQDLLEGRWHDSLQLLERTLYKSFARDIMGYHILPLVTEKGKIFVLAGPLHGQEGAEMDSITPVIMSCTEDGIEHVKRYEGLELKVESCQVLPSLMSLCS
ncbi:MAG: hypothetical protein K5922_10440 [Clostridiales bacterium]|nr:hypothetical protein [Clostridiales bacterium]